MNQNIQGPRQHAARQRYHPTQFRKWIMYLIRPSKIGGGCNELLFHKFRNGLKIYDTLAIPHYHDQNLHCFIAWIACFKNLWTKQNYRQLKNVLAQTSRPIDRFSILLNIAENISFHAGDPDSTYSIQLLQIAQDLHND